MDNSELSQTSPQYPNIHSGAFDNDFSLDSSNSSKARIAIEEREKQKKIWNSFSCARTPKRPPTAIETGTLYLFISYTHGRGVFPRTINPEKCYNCFCILFPLALTMANRPKKIELQRPSTFSHGRVNWVEAR